MAVHDNMGKNLIDFCLLERKLTPDAEGYVYADDATKTGIYHANGTKGFKDLPYLFAELQQRATVITLGDVQISFDGSNPPLFRKLGYEWVSLQLKE
jgi:hypothetical protein